MAGFFRSGKESQPPPQPYARLDGGLPPGPRGAVAPSRVPYTPRGGYEGDEKHNYSSPKQASYMDRKAPPSSGAALVSSSNHQFSSYLIQSVDIRLYQSPVMNLPIEIAWL